VVRSLRVAVLGHVDHGKSTTIGRLLHDTDSLPDGKLAELEAVSKSRGVPLEWSFVLDALQAERDQAVTIDTTRVWFTWNERRYAIIDAPGHREFIRNMLSGASEADAAVLVVDAIEGIGEQTRRHAHLARLLGLRQLAVAINKLDAVGFDQAVFDRLAADARALLQGLGLQARAMIPISARDGENLVKRSERTPWYDGPTVIEALDSFENLETPPDGPLRLRVQDVYRIDERRIVVGRVESGRVRLGDTIVLLPSGAHATVRSIDRWNAPQNDEATAGESIGLSFHEPVFVDRGDLIAHVESAPPLDYGFRAVAFWLSKAPPVVGEYLVAQFGPTVARVRIASIGKALDTSSLADVATGDVPQYAMLELDLRGRVLLPLDTQADLPATSRLVLLRENDVVGGGFVQNVAARATDLHPSGHLVTRAEREAVHGHRASVLWMTGLSGAGKSTIAMALERRLFGAGHNAFVLDGDNVRSGLNSDLGFAPADRSENLRRVAEVAELLAEAGTIAIVAFISPMEADREHARRTCGADFAEVYIATDVATCEARDVKGLYARARSGELREFTGVSAPYEAPANADITIETRGRSVDECVDELFAYVKAAVAI
jgi:bifunctional enzyme CysN/CysC